MMGVVVRQNKRNVAVAAVVVVVVVVVVVAVVAKNMGHEATNAQDYNIGHLSLSISISLYLSIEIYLNTTRGDARTGNTA